jgi:hypothetical protein
MKRKNQSYIKELEMPRLFREDLISIEKIIKEDLQPKEYKIETKEYEYESVNLIPDDHKTVTELRIQTYTPYISIEFNRFNARIYSADDDLKTTGALTKILEILVKKERRVLYWSQKTSTFLAPILFLVSFRLLVETGKLELTKQWLTLGIFISSIIWWVASFHTSMRRFSIINFALSRERPNFLQRNKDQIMLLIVGAILGTFFTVFFQSVIPK